MINLRQYTLLFGSFTIVEGFNVESSGLYALHRFEAMLNATEQVPTNPNAIEKMSQTLYGLMKRTQEEVDAKEAEFYEISLEKKKQLNLLTTDISSLTGDIARERSSFAEAKGTIETFDRRLRDSEVERQDIKNECSDTDKKDETELEELKKHLIFMKSIALSVKRSCDKKSFLQIGMITMSVQRCPDGTVTLKTPMGDASNALLQKPQDPNFKRKCTLTRQGCAKTVDLAHSLVGETEDAHNELEASLIREQARCKKLLTNNNMLIQDATNAKSTAQVAMAQAMSNLASISEQSVKKHQEFRMESKEFNELQKDTTAKLNDLKFTKTCGFRRLRKKLAEEAEMEKVPVDCEVGEWIPSGCSKECGGGIEISTREIILSANNGGVECPAIEWKRKCNIDSCPIACKTGEWDMWSSCTTDCGGGTRTRNRDLLQKARFGAAPCSVSETQLCNTGSCSRDCTLHPWTQWSACTRACGGGHQHRRRLVNKRAKGHGKCPQKHNKHRFLERACNTESCPKEKNLHCGAQYDVMLAVDSSGSWGNDAAFDEVKKVAVSLGQSFHGPIGVVEFGETAKTLSSAEDLTFLSGGTRIARGLIAAKNKLLTISRPDVPTLLFLITDGSTTSFHFEMNKIASELTRSGTRIILLSPKGGLVELPEPSSQAIQNLMKSLHIDPADVIIGDVSTIAREALLATCQYVKEGLLEVTSTTQDTETN